jgi:hypothetical protein
MVAFSPDRAGQLEAERALLLKAESDIEEGWNRLRRQQELLSELQAAGQNATQAERLIELLQHTIVEWERHRALIEERVRYLERQA